MGGNGALKLGCFSADTFSGRFSMPLSLQVLDWHGIFLFPTLRSSASANWNSQRCDTKRLV